MSWHLWNLYSPSGPFIFSKQVQGLESKEVNIFRKNCLRRANKYLKSSGRYWQIGTNICIREISWWTISVLFLEKKKKILNHSQNRHDLCLLNCPLLQISLLLLLLELRLCHLAHAVISHHAASDDPWQLVVVSWLHSYSITDWLFFISDTFLNGH